jgi:hypothetical protein
MIIAELVQEGVLWLLQLLSRHTYGEGLVQVLHRMYQHAFREAAWTACYPLYQSPLNCDTDCHKWIVVRDDCSVSCRVCALGSVSCPCVGGNRSVLRASDSVAVYIPYTVHVFAHDASELVVTPDVSQAVVPLPAGLIRLTLSRAF